MVAGGTGAKGFQMEEALRAYFVRAGYFVVRGVPFRLDAEDITDVDLWLYERPAAFTRRRLLVDVKNRKSPRAAERIVWAKGLQMALGLDAAIVATTDKRLASRRLAKNLSVSLFDGDAIDKLVGNEKLRSADILTASEFDGAVKAIDTGRRTSDWRESLYGARTSLLSGLGVQSANTNLGVFGFFAREAIYAQPGSQQAVFAIRLAYLVCALALISFDFLLADLAFRTPEERRSIIVNSVRFGHADAASSLPTVKTALALARKYAQNGAAVARQIEHGFNAEAAEIGAEIVADFVIRNAGGDIIFNAARELDAASLLRSLPTFDRLPNELKSALGAFLDFSGIAREKFANAGGEVSGRKTPDVNTKPSRSLFEDTQPDERFKSD